MSATTEEGRLTAWERWEMAEFDSGTGKPLAARAVKPPPEPTAEMPTAEEVERILRQARDEGYNAGYAEGQARARDEAGRLARAAGMLENALRDVDNGVANELLGLAIELARKVVGSEIRARPDVLVAVVHEALAQLPHQHAAIYLHPDDASLLRSYAGDQLAHAGHRILEDGKRARGDCVLDVGGSHLDATLATRWRRVIGGLGLDEAWVAPVPSADDEPAP